MKFEKIIFCCFLLLSGSLNAELMYNNQEQEDIELSFTPVEVLEEKAAYGDMRSKYLLALRKLHNKDLENKKEGIRMLEALANADIIDAYYTLYDVNKRGGIENLNSSKAIEYLKQGAEKGHPLAQLELARLYANGQLGKKDSAQSYYWVKKSAEQNNPDAMTYIAISYHLGVGVAKDDKKTFEWLIHAYNVLGRNYDEWGLLGQVYEEGVGTPINLTKAYMCYDLLGTAGIEEKARIAPRMTPEQRAEGLRLSQEWQAKNHVYTMQSLGLTRQKDGSYQ